MVFQYPEYQLFAETVKEDVAFGVRNFMPEKTEQEIEVMVKDALETVTGEGDEVVIDAYSGGGLLTAMIAKREYEEAHPDRRVFVLNSQTAGPEIALIIEEVRRLVLEEKDFDEICAAPEPSGRKLDFLLQEMNRETNTIGSKANNASIARLVVEIKGELEKIREQIQNVE